MEKEQQNPSLEPAKQAALELLFQNLPEDFRECEAALKDLRSAFQAKLAASISQPFWNHVRGQPQQTLVERTSLTTAMFTHLARLGLKLECPKTGRPGALLADLAKSSSSANPHYRFYVREHGRKRMTEKFDRLPELNIIAEHSNEPELLFPWMRSRTDESIDR